MPHLSLERLLNFDPFISIYLSHSEKMERMFERTFYAARWFLAPVFLGLSLALIALAIKFFQEIFHVLPHVISMSESDLILSLLSLIDMGLVGGLIGMLTGAGFGMMDIVLCAVSVLVFMLFTAYDTQKLKYYYAYYGGDASMLHKSSIIGALSLYLDYINIFLYIVRIVGRSRRDN